MSFTGVLMFVLKALLIALIAFPFVGTLGISWINHYFDKKEKYTSKLINAMNEAVQITMKKKKEGGES